MQRVLNVLIVLAVLVSACQTAAKPQAKAAPTAVSAPAVQQAPQGSAGTGMSKAETPQADASTIKAGDTGFSPLAGPPHNFMTFSLHFARPSTLKSWTIDFVAQDGTVVHEVNGTPPTLPPEVTWDGTADLGSPATEGNYVVKLSVDHGIDGGVETVQTDPILLDRTAASGSISISPQPYSPGDPDKILNPPQVTMTLMVTPGIATVDSWRLFVTHPNGTQFMSFISEEHKDNVVVWNGRAQNNASLEPNTNYDLNVQIFDRYGNVGTIKSTLQVGAGMETMKLGASKVDMETVKPQPQETPVTVSFDGAVVAKTNIYFPAYSADLSKVDTVKKALNSQAFDTLAAALKSANGTKIKVVGHANKVFWQDQTKGDREQMYVLVPLSKDRAHSVQQALVDRGIDPALFDLDGVGAIGAVAPFGDLTNNWKNRRVEFNVEN